MWDSTFISDSASARERQNMTANETRSTSGFEISFSMCYTVNWQLINKILCMTLLPTLNSVTP